jgi:uridylate kinase
MNSVIFKNLLAANSCPAEVFSTLHVRNITEAFTKKSALQALNENKVVICAGGTGNPFFTTDSAAALKALELDCDLLCKATKVDGVFDSDPAKNPEAKKYDEISFNQVLSQELQVMDLAAVALCMEKKLPILVFDLNQEDSLEKALAGEKVGTIIS